MYELTGGALDRIMNRIEVVKPILQILGLREAVCTDSPNRYFLTVSDGVKINSYAMLDTQLDSLVTEKKITEFSLCQINQFVISIINNDGQHQEVMVIQSIDVKVPGTQVARKIGNPTQQDGPQQNANTAPGTPAAARPTQGHDVLPQHSQLNETLSAGSEVITRIATLRPGQTGWKIRARVAKKMPITPYGVPQRGSYFSMDLSDETAQIRCVAFDNECEKFYEMIESDKFYYISNCLVEQIKKDCFKKLNNDYEMKMNSATEEKSDFTDVVASQYKLRPASHGPGINPDGTVGSQSSMTDPTENR